MAKTQLNREDTIVVKDKDGVERDIAIGEIIEVVSTFAVGNIIKALKELRGEFDKTATEKGGGLPENMRPLRGASAMRPKDDWKPLNTGIAD